MNVYTPKVVAPLKKSTAYKSKMWSYNNNNSRKEPRLYFIIFCSQSSPEILGICLGSKYNHMIGLMISLFSG